LGGGGNYLFGGVKGRGKKRKNHGGYPHLTDNHPFRGAKNGSRKLPEKEEQKK